MPTKKSAPQPHSKAQPQPQPQPHTKWSAAVLIGVAASLLLALVVLAFLWPSKTAEVHNLPVSLAGPQAASTALEEALGSSGTFDFVTADDRADAVSQIKTQKTYGAIVFTTANSIEVLTAPAASTVAAQLLGGVASELKQRIAAAGGDANATQITVTPIVPLSAGDPSGTGLATASFPLAIGGMIGGVLLSLLVVGAIRRLVAAAGFAVVAGIVLALILQTWFGYLQGNFWINALAMGLTMLATSTFIIGCTSLIGRAGIAVGAIVTIFIGNPLSASAVPWQFLVAPWGAIGQFLVPGASSALIRSLSYFPDANRAQQWWTLAAWVALGVVLTLVGHYRSRPSMHVPEVTIEPPLAKTASA